VQSRLVSTAKVNPEDNQRGQFFSDTLQIRPRQSPDRGEKVVDQNQSGVLKGRALEWMFSFHRPENKKARNPFTGNRAFAIAALTPAMSSLETYGGDYSSFSEKSRTICTGTGTQVLQRLQSDSALAPKRVTGALRTAPSKIIERQHGQRTGCGLGD
jgi:hypothetical protein